MSSGNLTAAREHWGVNRSQGLSENCLGKKFSQGQLFIVNFTFRLTPVFGSTVVAYWFKWCIFVLHCIALLLELSN